MRATPRARSKSKPLFYDSEKEESDDETLGRLDTIGEETSQTPDNPDYDEEGLTRTLRSSRGSTEPTARRPLKRKAPARAMEDSVSDDGTFRGFKGKRGKIA